MKLKTREYKWIAHRGERYQQTVGMGFFTKKEALIFARRENRRFNSGYTVDRVSAVNNPHFN